MIKSMTGFAGLTHEDDRVTIGITLRSVNHRYFDAQVRMPQTLSQLEPKLRALLQRHVARGRIELAVSVQLRQEPVLEVELNEAFSTALSGALDRARARGLVEGVLTPGDLLRMPQALTVREQAVEPDAELAGQVESAVEAAVERAVFELDGMRRREGDHLRTDLDARKAAVAALVERVALAAGRGEADLQARLAERIQELTRDLQVDRGAIAQEVVRFAARSDISEEVVRFRAHVAQWTALSDSAEPCGRKLDFLLQEMNREVNTMGSKADGTEVTELIIAAKAELEKMREQVQNVE
jgi:uncharacterized protein (TIGR00255 family)